MPVATDRVDRSRADVEASTWRFNRLVELVVSVDRSDEMAELVLVGICLEFVRAEPEFGLADARFPSKKGQRLNRRVLTFQKTSIRSLRKRAASRLDMHRSALASS